MRYFLSLRQPEVTRMLLIESGSRAHLEQFILHLRGSWGAHIQTDLVTCYAGLPNGFSPETRVYRVTDYTSRESRGNLIQELCRQNYSAVGMICSGEPVMTKWKSLIALRVPAKLLILNENGDYFWVDRENLATLREFVLVRLGLAGSGAIRTIGRLLIFPFSVLFLLLYAFAAHARRLLRLMLHPEKS